MGRSVLSCTAVFLVICLYFVTNQVKCQDGVTSACPDGMGFGDLKTYPNCMRCECEENGLSCKSCPAGAHVNVPKGCKKQRKAGDFPICCEMEAVCEEN